MDGKHERVAAAGEQRGGAFHEHGLPVRGRKQRSGDIRLAPTLDGLGAGGGGNLAGCVGAVLPGSQRTGAADEGGLEQGGGRMRHAQDVGAILANEGGGARRQRGGHAGAAHEAIVGVGVQQTPACVRGGARARGHDVRAGRHEIGLGPAVRRGAPGGERRHALRFAAGAGGNQIGGNGRGAVVEPPRAEIGAGGVAAAARGALAFGGADGQHVLGRARGIQRVGVHHAVEVGVDPRVAGGIGHEHVGMVPDELVGGHRVGVVFAADMAAPAVGMDARAEVVGRLIEIVEIVGESGKTFGGVHEGLKRELGGGGRSAILAVRSRARAEQGAGDMGSVIIGVAPIGQPAEVEHLDQAAREIGVEGGEVARVEAGVGDRDDLARAIEAVVRARGIDVQMFRGPRPIIQDLRQLVVFDPLDFGQPGEVHGGAGGQHGPHQAPALARRGSDVRRPRGGQLPRQTGDVVGRKCLDGDRQGQVGLLPGHRGQHGLDLVRREVFSRPGHGGKPADPRQRIRGRFDQQRVVGQICAEDGARVCQLRFPFRPDGAGEEHHPRIPPGGGARMDGRARRRGRREGGRAQADRRARGLRRGRRAGQIPLNLPDRGFRLPPGFVAGQARGGGAGFGRSHESPEENPGEGGAGDPSQADEGAGVHDHLSKNITPPGESQGGPAPYPFLTVPQIIDILRP